MPSGCTKTQIIDFLWKNYLPSIPYYDTVFKNNKPVLDHLAIIDLPRSDNSGIPFLKSIFSELGFVETGSGYLPEKQNDFIWMTDPTSQSQEADKALPQVVLADFRLENLSPTVQKIISKYSKTTKPIDQSKINDSQYLEKYFFTRAWDLPTIADYNAVKHENQLLAWVLLFGRKVNHFGANITFEKDFSDLWEFNKYLKTLSFTELNSIEGEVKGGEHQGIAQSSTIGQSVKIKAADGYVDAHNSFMEFVWRYPKHSNPKMWGDYFTGFVAQNANHVIESLYDKQD
jgi:hypothetical protein